MRFPRSRFRLFAAISALRQMAFVLLAGIAICPSAVHAASLYERLGGEPVVSVIASELIRTAAKDPATSRSFEGVRLQNTERQLAAQICELTGGGCHRDGDNMKDVHGGQGITQQEFYALVEMLRDVMVRHGVALRERNELLALLAPMKRDIVER